MFSAFARRGLLAIAAFMLLAALGLPAYQAQATPLAQVATPTPLPPSPTSAPPAATPTPAATVAPSPTQSHTGRVFISCVYYGPYDREFDLMLEQGHGGAPTVDVTIDLVTGGTQTDHFTAYSNSYRGPYLTLSATASWPDQATGYASATCGYAIPTDTPLPSNTPDYSLTPTPTNTPTPTRLPREGSSPTPAEFASPTPPAGQVTPVPGTPSPADSSPTPGSTLTPALSSPTASPMPPIVPFTPTAIGSKPSPHASPTATLTSDTGNASGSFPGLPRTGQGDNFTLWLLVLMLLAFGAGYWLRQRSRQTGS